MVVEEVGIFSVLLKELPALAAVLTGVIILGYLLYIKTQQITQKNEEANQQRYAELVKTAKTIEEANQQRYAELVKTSQDRYEELVKTSQDRYINSVTTSQDRYEELTNRYIDSMSKIATDNIRCMTDLCSKIDAQREELKEHTATKDRALEMLYNKDETIRTLLQRNQDLYDMLKDQIRYPNGKK